MTTRRGRRDIPGWRPLLGVGLVLLGAAAPAAAQQAFRGRVIDDATGRAVPQAQVSLLQGDRRITAVAADGSGRFFLPTGLTGELALEVSALGYTTARSTPVEMEFQDTLAVEFRILPDAILLEPLLVTGRSSQGRNIFARREREWGRGIFLDPDDIAALELRHAGDVFRGQEKVWLSWGQGRSKSGGVITVPRVKTYLGSGCLKYMVDRVPVRPPPWDEDADPWTLFPLDGLHPEDIQGVEIYRYVGEAPPEIRRHATWEDFRLCGLVVFWTRAGW